MSEEKKKFYELLNKAISSELKTAKNGELVPIKKKKQEPEDTLIPTDEQNSSQNNPSCDSETNTKQDTPE